MIEDILTFVSVEFPDDPNVEGICYWYLCNFPDPKVGDKVIAPLGRHNNTQTGIIRQVRVTEEYNSPYPIYMIKFIREIIR